MKLLNRKGKNKVKKLELRLRTIEDMANIDLPSIMNSYKNCQTDSEEKYRKRYENKRVAFNIGVCECLLACDIEYTSEGELCITNFNQLIPNNEQLDRIETAIESVLKIENVANTVDDDKPIPNKRPIEVNRATPKSVRYHIVGSNGLIGLPLDMEDFKYISKLGVSLRKRRDKMRLITDVCALAVLGGAAASSYMISNNKSKHQRNQSIDNNEQLSSPDVSPVQIPDSDIPSISDTTIDNPEIVIVDNDVPNVKLDNVDVPVLNTIDPAKVENNKTIDEMSTAEDSFVVE